MSHQMVSLFLGTFEYLLSNTFVIPVYPLEGFVITKEIACNCKVSPYESDHIKGAPQCFCKSVLYNFYFMFHFLHFPFSSPFLFLIITMTNRYSTANPISPFNISCLILVQICMGHTLSASSNSYSKITKMAPRIFCIFLALASRQVSISL